MGGSGRHEMRLGELLERLECEARPPVDPERGDLAMLQAWVRRRQRLLDAIRERVVHEGLTPETRARLSHRMERLRRQDQAVLTALERRREVLEEQVRKVLEGREAVRGYGASLGDRTPGAGVDRTA